MDRLVLPTKITEIAQELQNEGEFCSRNVMVSKILLCLLCCNIITRLSLLPGVACVGGGAFKHKLPINTHCI